MNVPRAVGARYLSIALFPQEATKSGIHDEFSVIRRRETILLKGFEKRVSILKWLHFVGYGPGWKFRFL